MIATPGEPGVAIIVFPLQLHQPEKRGHLRSKSNHHHHRDLPMDQNPFEQFQRDLVTLAWSSGLSRFGQNGEKPHESGCRGKYLGEGSWLEAPRGPPATSVNEPPPP